VTLVMHGVVKWSERKRVALAVAKVRRKKMKEI
jgi:hypothetical protein